MARVTAAMEQEPEVPAALARLAAELRAPGRPARLA
jgi:hypothetical protein